MKYNYRLTFAVAAALGLLVITLVILVHPAFVFGIILLGFMIIPVVIFPDPLYSCTCQKCRGMRCWLVVMEDGTGYNRHAKIRAYTTEGIANAQATKLNKPYKRHVKTDFLDGKIKYEYETVTPPKHIVVRYVPCTKSLTFTANLNNYIFQNGQS